MPTKLLVFSLLPLLHVAPAFHAAGSPTSTCCKGWGSPAGGLLVSLGRCKSSAPTPASTVVWPVSAGTSPGSPSSASGCSVSPLLLLAVEAAGAGACCPAELLLMAAAEAQAAHQLGLPCMRGNRASAVGWLQHSSWAPHLLQPTASLSPTALRHACSTVLQRWV